MIMNSSIRRMAHIQRYSSFPTNRKENVAEHTFYCTITAHCIALDLLDRGFDIDPNVVVVKAIYHDGEESLTGDLPG